MTAKIDGQGNAGLVGSGDGVGDPTWIGRKSVLMGMAASVGFVLANSGQTSAAAVTTLAGVSGIDVTSMGAMGNGVTDDTAAVRAAIVTAAGAEVYFPKGTYVLDGLVVDTTARLHLDPAVTLLAKPNSPSGCMFAFTGTELKIRGGTINGNKSNQVTPNPKGRPVIIAGAVQQGKTVDVAEVLFTSTVKAAFYLSEFGGLLSVEHCQFTDQAEHTGVLNVGLSMIVYVTSGQAGAKGYVRFNHNRAIGTVTPKLPGSNPGGVFISPSTAANPLVGNMTTLEATGNYFWGYGQNCVGNTISPFHLYRSTMGARITANYFEQCSFSAISAKSVTDFVCTNNVFIGGAISAQNVANEGVISYVPGYNAGSVVQPRDVITGNIIEKAGGQSATLLQNGISVHGTSTSRGTDILVAGNIINGGGAGIQIVYADDIKISENIIKGGGVGIQVNYVGDIVISGNTIQGGTGTSAVAGLQSGISLGQMTGEVLIANNAIETLKGHGIVAITGVNTARFTLQGNKFLHAAAGYFAAVLRGVAFLKLSGNEFNATAGVALNVQADAAAHKVGRLAYDLSNTIVAGSLSFVWPDILKATGQLRAPRSPVGVVTPGEVGTMYHQSDGLGDIWVARGTTRSSWRKIPLA